MYEAAIPLLLAEEIIERAIGQWQAITLLIVQGGFGLFLWYFVAKWMPRREAEYREDLKAFLNELAEERKSRERDQTAYMQSLTDLREQAYKMRQEDRAATHVFLERFMNEFMTTLREEREHVQPK